MSKTDRAFLGYKLALGLAAGGDSDSLRIVAGGSARGLFPTDPVHGMLASIGIIIAKQAYEVIGVTPTKGSGRSN